MDIGVQRSEAWLDAGGKCLICGKKADDLHHIVSRRFTQGNAEARELANAKELCAPLCKKDHAKAGNPAARTLLLGILIRRYGFDKVKERLDAVKEVMRGTLDIDLPEGE